MSKPSKRRVSTLPCRTRPRIVLCIADRQTDPLQIWSLVAVVIKAYSTCPRERQALRPSPMQWRACNGAPRAAQVGRRHGSSIESRAVAGQRRLPSSAATRLLHSGGIHARTRAESRRVRARAEGRNVDRRMQIVANGFHVRREMGGLFAVLRSFFLGGRNAFPCRASARPDRRHRCGFVRRRNRQDVRRVQTVGRPQEKACRKVRPQRGGQARRGSGGCECGTASDARRSDDGPSLKNAGGMAFAR